MLFAYNVQNAVAEEGDFSNSEGEQTTEIAAQCEDSQQYESDEATSSEDDGISSNDNETVTLTQKGRILKPDGSPCSNAHIQLHFGDWVYGVEANTNGEFSCTHNQELSDEGFSVNIELHSRNTVGENPIIVARPKSENPSLTPSYTTHDYGDLTCRKQIFASYCINGTETTESSVGSWSGEWTAEKQDFFKNSQEYLDNIDGTFSIVENTLYYNNIWYNPDGSWWDSIGWESNAVLNINIKEGYELDKILITDADGADCGTSGFLTKPSYVINAVIVPKAIKHTVTFDSGISQVLDNGTPITSGSEVAEGTELTIVPATQVDKITKVYVNKSLYLTNKITVDKDLNIAGALKDSVTISGIVSNSSTQSSYYSQLTSNESDNAAIANASVSFTDDEGWSTSTTSDENGAFSIDVQKALGGTLTITAQGYETFSKTFSSTDLSDDADCDVILNKSKDVDPSDDEDVNPVINNETSTVSSDTASSNTIDNGTSSTKTGDYMMLIFLVFALMSSGFGAFALRKFVHK